MFTGRKEGLAAGLAYFHVAAITVDIAGRMADLAREGVLIVHHVHDDFIFTSNDRFMAGFTSRAFNAVITMHRWWSVRINNLLAMKFRARMAGEAGHASLAKMHVCQQSFVFTQKLIAHPAAMAGGAGAGHRRIADEHVAIQ